VKDHFGCPVQATYNVLARKWKVLIVWYLTFGSRRFAELRDLLPGISEKVLTSQLRQLEHDGIVRRLVTASVPPRVDYMLSSAGKDLVPVMEAMCHGATKHLWSEAEPAPLRGISLNPLLRIICIICV